MFIRKYFGNIPDRIGLHANDVNIAKYIAYVNELNIVCYDTAGLRPINADKLEDLYTKGILLSNGGLFYTPTAMIKGDETLISFIRYNSVSEEMEYVSASSSEEIEIPVLSALSIGNKTLTPAFDPEILAYTLSTEDASDILTLDMFPDDSIVTVTLGETVLEDYAEGITWADGENTLTIALEKGDLSTEYVITVTASLPAPTLSALAIGSLTLSPSFDSGVVAYTAATTDASNILTFTTVPEDAPVVVKLGDAPITTYSEGVAWAGGENILTITVGEAPAAVTYTVTVTAS